MTILKLALMRGKSARATRPAEPSYAPTQTQGSPQNLAGECFTGLRENFTT